MPEQQQQPQSPLEQLVGGALRGIIRNQVKNQLSSALAGTTTPQITNPALISSLLSPTGTAPIATSVSTGLPASAGQLATSPIASSVSTGLPATAAELGATPTVGAGILPGLGIAAGATTGALQLGGLVNALRGNELSTTEHAALFPVTGGFSLLADVFNKNFGGANPRENQRRNVAKVLGTFFDNKNNHGHAILNTPTAGEIELTTNADFLDPENNELHSFAIELANPIAAGITGITAEKGFKPNSGGFDNLQVDFATFLADTLVRGAENREDVLSNFNSFIEQSPFSKDNLFSGVLELSTTDDTISADFTAAMLAGLDTFFRGQNASE